MKLEEGYYRCIERTEKNGCPTGSTWVGPFPSALHAWDNAYANGELNEKKSDRARQIAYTKESDYSSIVSAKYLQEDVDYLAETGYTVTIVPPPVPKYSNLLDEDGLLCL